MLSMVSSLYWALVIGAFAFTLLLLLLVDALKRFPRIREFFSKNDEALNLVAILSSIITMASLIFAAVTIAGAQDAADEQAVAESDHRMLALTLEATLSSTIADHVIERVSAKVPFATSSRFHYAMMESMLANGEVRNPDALQKCWAAYLLMDDVNRSLEQHSELDLLKLGVPSLLTIQLTNGKIQERIDELQLHILESSRRAKRNLDWIAENIPVGESDTPE